jgi:hypothetical protein
VKLERLFLNVPIQPTGEDRYWSKEGQFCLLQVVYHNVWDHRMATHYNPVKMIDSDEFQHSQLDNDYDILHNVLLPGQETVYLTPLSRPRIEKNKVDF